MKVILQSFPCLFYLCTCLLITYVVLKVEYRKWEENLFEIFIYITIRAYTQRQQFGKCNLENISIFGNSIFTFMSILLGSSVYFFQQGIITNITDILERNISLSPASTLSVVQWRNYNATSSALWFVSGRHTVQVIV